MDTKALFTQRLDAARTAWTKGDEPAAAESLREAIVAARSEPSLRAELASALFDLGRLLRKFGPAAEAEAGPVLTEALAISEELFGRGDAGLAPVLHELSRLYLQTSQHARAGNALERLLAITRVKGEEHPDVATALADLAFVKRKLGDDASAEALYRDALRIREKTLEPNHTVTVGTLERLAETCAARGNVAEALALLHRALPVREATLGAGHERVRAARSRVDELETQMAAGAAAPARVAEPTPAPVRRGPDSPADTPSTPVTSPINVHELQFLGASEPAGLRRSPLARDRAKTPTFAAAVAAASLIVTSMPTPSVPQIVISAPERAGSRGSIPARESGVAHRDAVLTEAVGAGVLHADVASSDVAVGDWRSVAPEPRKKRTGLYASAGVAAVVLAMAGLLMLRPRAVSGRGPAVSKEMSATQRSTATTAAGAPVVTAPAANTAAAGMAGAAVIVAAARVDSVRTASATPAPTAAAIEREQDVPKTAPPVLHAPRVVVHLDSTNLPSMPASPSADAILRSAMERQRASDTERAETKSVVASPAPGDVTNAHTSPKIIGRAPDPGFPDELIRSGRREGQVVVRFIVNELGRVDLSSMIVERSDHELFTAAVREVLPLFRFEPAHTLTSDSKPVAVWVSVPFRFTTKRK